MDYETLYLEANDKVATRFGTNVAKEIFSDLYESEDERIRKVLVELVKCNERCGYFMINNTTTSSMLAWLEKQGKSGKEVSDKIESELVWEDKLGKKIERLKSQSMVSAEAKEFLYGKPVWSEEDESILQGIWDEILANKHDAKEYEWKTYDKFLDWLKSLKQRIGG